MTSRERVLSAINFEETDRVPIDFGGHRSSGISAIAYRRLKETLGIRSGDIYVYDVIQQLAVVEPEVLDALGGDVVELGRAFLREDDEWQEWTLPDGTPCKIPGFVNIERRGADWHLLSDDGFSLGIQKEGTLYFEQTYWPWLDRAPDDQDFSDLEETFSRSMWTAVPCPGSHIPLTDDGLERLADGARALRTSTDRAIIGLFGGNLFEVPQFFYRIDNYLTHLALYPDACRRLVDALAGFHLKRLERWLSAVGEYIDVILFGDDLGGQNGPLISPDMYRTVIKDGHSRIWRRAKELAPHALIHLHSCGGIEQLMADLIDAGLESENPVQINCVGMDPSHLKSTYGMHIPRQCWLPAPLIGLKATTCGLGTSLVYPMYGRLQAPHVQQTTGRNRSTATPDTAHATKDVV